MLHIKKIKPLFTSVVTTADKFGKDMTSGGLIIAKKGDLKVWQKVIAIGSSVRDINVGDMVMINVDHYAVKKYDKNSLQNDMDNNATIRYAFNYVDLYDDNGNAQECLLLNDRDILYSFEGEEVEDNIIIPDKPKVVVS